MEMEVMSLKKFDELAALKEDRCISIYIPTHRAGAEVEGDRIRFKDEVKVVKKELTETYGMREDEVEELLSPARKLIDDELFWHYNGDGLAVFLSREHQKAFRLPLSFETYHSISDRFYLHPIFPFFNGDGRFYIIGVSEKMVKLWEASRFKIREVPLGEGFPQRIEDVVGYDFEEKTLQERSFKGQGSGSVMHGHGEGRDEEKNELERFFRAVDRGLSEMLHDEHVPLVFAGVEHYYGQYRKLAHYRQLVDTGFIKGNPEQMGLEQLHEKGWELVHERFDKDRDHFIKQYQDSMGNDKAVSDNAEVVKAAADGRVEALFIQEGVHLPGSYSEEERKVNFSEANAPDKLDLVEKAAMDTYEKDGRVFILPADRMPEPSTQLDALLRY